MKHLVYVLISIWASLFCSYTYAQSIFDNVESRKILKFKNIPLTGDIKEFDIKMKDNNFIFIGDLYSSYNYIGLFYGRKVDAKVQYVPEANQVSSVIVIFPEKGDDATKLYEHLAKQLCKKYNAIKDLSGDGLLTYSYGEEYKITLSIGNQSNIVFLTYSNKAKSEERYFYQNKHKEWMSEHQKDL